MRFQVYRQYIIKRHPFKIVRGLRLNMHEYGEWQTEEIIEASSTVDAWNKVARKRNCQTLVDPLPEAK